MNPAIVASVEGPNEPDDSYAIAQLGASTPAQARQDAANEMLAVAAVAPISIGEADLRPGQFNPQHLPTVNSRRQTAVNMKLD